ncbi:Inactive hydroxysteroid dehydrogenase-like protein 1 [Portunus trituberculatus]|uniref:Inactive hydroxysteroid dehydrogenase-like protein 1 n=1 Tax=Portunus trituberculatus TaxID=210409 RepID=A0A5B7GI05_PORTR|nr:Inactive hydroxysteroid dehydrogenase-like protein 1 [Portunus trituberculatus]
MPSSYPPSLPGVFVPTAQTYASSAINTLGYARHTTGYWAHSLQVGVC